MTWEPGALDPDFWDRERDLLFELIFPDLTEAVLGGAYTGWGAIVAQTGLEWGLVNRAAVETAKAYIYDLVSDITDVTKEYLADTIGRYIQSGEPLSALEKELASSGYFSSSRAEAIASTEVTRAFAEGNLAAWGNTGGFVTGKRWATAVDELVCEICGPLDGLVVELNSDKFPVGEGSGVGAPPAHVRCRCWLQPVTDPIFQTEEERERALLDQLQPASLADLKIDYRAELELDPNMPKHVQDYHKRRWNSTPENLKYGLRRAEFYNKQGYKFEVEGKLMRAGGDYNFQHKRIRVFQAGNKAYTADNWNYVMRHELGHHFDNMWDRMARIEADRLTTLFPGLDKYDSAGFLKKEFADKAPMLNFRDRWNKAWLAGEDGITEYSKAWASDNAVNFTETIAELTRLYLTYGKPELLITGQFENAPTLVQIFMDVFEYYLGLEMPK